MQLQWLRPSRALIRLALPTSGLRATDTGLHPERRITGDCCEVYEDELDVVRSNSDQNSS
jgi:hypothetical protein